MLSRFSNLITGNYLAIFKKNYDYRHQRHWITSLGIFSTLLIAILDLNGVMLPTRVPPRQNSLRTFNSSTWHRVLLSTTNQLRPARLLLAVQRWGSTPLQLLQDEVNSQLTELMMNPYAPKQIVGWQKGGFEKKWITHTHTSATVWHQRLARKPQCQIFI